MDMPEIFRINRVNKAIISLAERIASAQEIAESIPPIKTAVLNLQGEEGSPPISTPTNPTPTIPSQENGLQLGAIFPNAIIPPKQKTERLFFVVVVKGNPNEFFVTNNIGEKLSWKITQMYMKDFCEYPNYKDIKTEVEKIEGSNEGVEVLLFFIEIPDNLQDDSSYRFVAKQDSEEDQLILTVSNHEFHRYIAR